MYLVYITTLPCLVIREYYKQRQSAEDICMLVRISKIGVGPKSLRIFNWEYAGSCDSKKESLFFPSILLIIEAKNKGPPFPTENAYAAMRCLTFGPIH